MFGFGKKKNKTTKYEAPQPQQPKRTSKLETYKVAGISHRLENLLSLKEEDTFYDMTKKDIIDMGMEDEKIFQYSFPDTPVELIKEPDNPADKNAIKVMLAGVHIGYIPKKYNKHVAELMDAGRVGKMSVEAAGGKYKKVISEEDERGKEVYFLERGETSFFAKIYISVRCVTDDEA